VRSATRPVEFFPLTFGAPVGALALGFPPVFLLDTMVQIIEHRDFIPEDFPMEEEAASSMPRSSNRPATGAAAVHAAQQDTHVQTSRASRAAPGALYAARELLRNPSSSTTSPGAMRQWREDVDRLLGMAHSGSARPRPRSFRCQREASASVHSPLVRGARTNYLRAELNRRCAAEDAQISLERDNDL
jgi:pyruvate/2-oxoglutarate dehydrogenase complex dihydrolipoamide acyltransferase (E2) component